MAQKKNVARSGKSKDRSRKPIKKDSIGAQSKASPRAEKVNGTLVIGPLPSETEDNFKDANKKIADSIIAKKPLENAVDITQHYLLSQSTLPGYLTLDWNHRNNISDLKREISAYAENKRLKRPLNVMLRAAPGSGKSHLVNCLTQSLHADSIKLVSFNMTCMEDMNDLVQPLEEVRNVKVNDHVPLLFLDEFDDKNNKYPILLPLLWDGELKVGQRDLKVGKIVIILAGSGSIIEDTADAMKEMRPDIALKEGNVPNKLPDLLSRINGREIGIPGLDEESKSRNRKVDKVCLSIALLEQRFERQLDRLPWALLSFIAQTNFRYGARSIYNLVYSIDEDSVKNKTLSIADCGLPFGSARDLQNSSLGYHMSAKDGASEIIGRWGKLTQYDASVVFRSNQQYQTGYFEEHWKTIFDYYECQRASSTKFVTPKSEISE